MGLEAGNLKRLIHPELHIDEFKSKLGDDKDICVVSFKVLGKDPALDLVNFVEKGYSWIVDADVSSGEMEDGDYIVFVEMERTPQLPENIMAMMADIMRLTEQELSDWRIRYRSGTSDHEATEESLAAMIPLNPEDYTAKYGDDESEDDTETDQEDISESLNKLRAVSGVTVTHTAPKNDFTEALRTAAGIR
jgi:hypothetical protein